MIVPTMTIDEILKEIVNEKQFLLKKKEELAKAYGKVVLKHTSFPLVKYFTFKTPKKQNVYIYQFIYSKRGNWDNPNYMLYGIYTRPEGKYMVVPTNEFTGLDIYPPHFFKRYRERIVKDDKLTTNQLIQRYIEHQNGIIYQVADGTDRALFSSCESDDEQQIEVIAAVEEGFCFGVHQNKINIVKTIISEEMLYENQKERFMELKQLMHICFYQKKTVGEDFFEYGARTALKSDDRSVNLQGYNHRFTHL